MDVAHLGARQACGLGLAVAALGTGALAIDALVERTLAIQGHAHLSTQFPIGVLDTAFLLEKLRVATVLAGRLGKEQGTAKALGTVAVGMGELVGGVHAQALRAERGAIGIALALRMAMAIEGNGGDAATGHGLIDVPGRDSRHQR